MIDQSPNKVQIKKTDTLKLALVIFTIPWLIAMIDSISSEEYETSIFLGGVYLLFCLFVFIKPPHSMASSSKSSQKKIASTAANLGLSLFVYVVIPLIIGFLLIGLRWIFIVFGPR